MNNVGILVVRNVKTILLSGSAVLVAEIGICWWAYQSAGVSNPLGKALESVGGFLMTLDSPESIAITSTPLCIAHYLGWAVSLFGWLLVPLLIGVSLSRSQSLDQEYHELHYRLLRRAERCGLNKHAASAYVSEMITTLEDIAAKGKGIDGGAN